MRRRTFVFAAGVAMLPVEGWGQRTAASLPRIVMMTSGDGERFANARGAFASGMAEAGFAEDSSYRLEVRAANGEENVPAKMREVVASKPDMIVVGGLRMASVAKQATATIPIVVMTASDPVAAGLVASLSRPGGNLTGIGDSTSDTIAKRVELAADLVPAAKVLALVVEVRFPLAEAMVRQARETAERRGLRVVELPLLDRATLGQALGVLAQAKPGIVVTMGSVTIINNFEAIVAAANRARVPIVHFWLTQAGQGALATHGPDPLDNARRSARLAAQILRGAKPGDLPYELASNFQVVIDLRVARALSITVPPAVLARADRVIE